MPKTLSVVGIVDAEVASELAQSLADRNTLAAVLAWSRLQLPPRGVSHIVTQDEYTYERGALVERAGVAGVRHHVSGRRDGGRRLGSLTNRR